jgi:hypothetical protein
MFNRYVVVGWVLKEKLKEVVSHEILHEKAPNKYYKLIKSYRNFNYRITKIILCKEEPNLLLQFNFIISFNKENSNEKKNYYIVKIIEYFIS